MNYSEKSTWKLEVVFLNDDIDIKYSYVILDDFDPSRTECWEPRVDRILIKGQKPDTDEWGVLFQCFYILLLFILDRK
jgi:hypothetical protein